MLNNSCFAWPNRKFRSTITAPVAGAESVAVTVSAPASSANAPPLESVRFTVGSPVSVAVTEVELPSVPPPVRARMAASFALDARKVRSDKENLREPMLTTTVSSSALSVSMPVRVAVPLRLPAGMVIDVADAA